MKTIKYILLVLTTLIFLSCSTQSSEGPITIAKDSVLLKDTTSAGEQVAMQSEITCPECGYKKMETMPDEVCLLKYKCEACNTEMRAVEDDCCVFCTYGNVKCPSMQ